MDTMGVLYSYDTLEVEIFGTLEELYKLPISHLDVNLLDKKRMKEDEKAQRQKAQRGKD